MRLGGRKQPNVAKGELSTRKTEVASVEVGISKKFSEQIKHETQENKLAKVGLS